MTEQQITALGPAFGSYLRRFRDHFGQDRTAKHFDTYCRGLLSDLPRKSIEPIARAAGTAVRTLQEFLVTSDGEYASSLDTRQKNLRSALADVPADPLGAVGVIDVTSCRQWGTARRGCRASTWGASARWTTGS